MSKSTGIIRRVDDLGRVVIPKEIRRVMDIQDEAPLEIFADREKGEVILRPYKPGCVFCGELHEGKMSILRGKLICPNCAREEVRPAR